MAGAALLVVGALGGGQLAIGTALGSPPDTAVRTALSPYRDGAFTVRAAAVDARVDIASAEDGSYVLGHTPAGSDVVLDLGLLAGDTARPWWVDPSSGRTVQLADLVSEGIARFPVPGGGPTAWVLVLDDAGAGYGAPDAGAVAEALRSARDDGPSGRRGRGAGDAVTGTDGGGSGSPDAGAERDTEGRGSGADPGERPAADGDAADRSEAGRSEGDGVSGTSGGGERATADGDLDRGSDHDGGAGAGDDGAAGGTPKSRGGSTGNHTTGERSSDEHGDVRSTSDRGAGERGAGERSTGEHSASDRSSGERSTGEPGTGDRSTADRGTGGRRTGDRGPEEGRTGERGTGERADIERSTGAGQGPAGTGDTRPRDDVPSAGEAPASETAPEDRVFPGSAPGKPAPGKPAPGKPASGKPASDKPAREQPARDKPTPAKPTPEKAGKPAPRRSAPDEPAPRKPAAPKQGTQPTDWDRLARCESSGDWGISTGNGYYGGLQFDKATWSDFGGTAYAPTADGASKEQQIEIATKVRDARGGYGSWPACARKLGLAR
nr:transglycosylase family protein [Pseudonocardia sp. C8]